MTPSAIGSRAGGGAVPAGIPTPGNLFKPGSTARAKSIRARNLDEDQLTYAITVEYASNAGDQPDPATGQNPLDAPPRYSWGGSVTAEPFFRDESEEPEDWTEADGNWTGKPVVTSAGEDFANLPERQVTYGTLTITRNEAQYFDWIAETFKNTTNAANVVIRGTTYPPGTLLMNNVTGEGPNVATIPDPSNPEQTVDVTYFVTTYDISKSAQGFDFKPEDRGAQALHINTTIDSDSGEPVTIAKVKPILDAAGNPVIMPYPLDGEGQPMPNATDSPAVLTFRRYRRADWSELALNDLE